tara:strand:+ start:7968 stop:9392 length:1425 start_codon:yes stop_codon:yes gene_type:complete
MAVTTTLNPTGDTFLRQDQATTNYGTSVLLRVGQFSGGNRRHGLLQFSTSSFTYPSRIVSSVLTLTEQNTFGTTTRTMKLCRNTQTATNTATATWSTYDGSTSWSDGGEADSAQTEPMYSVSVGNSVGNAVLDINDLVVDSVVRRGDELDMILCFDKTDTNTSDIGNSIFYSVDNSSASDRPKLVVKEAEVFYWTGAAGTDADTARNWIKETDGSFAVPTNNDYVYFNSGSVDVLSGTINCDSMFVSEGYTGNIGTSSTAITIRADGDRTLVDDKKLVINKKSGIFNLSAYTLTKQSVYISNCPEGCKYTGAVSFNCYINRTSGNVDIVGDSNLITTGDEASRITTSGTATSIKSIDGNITLDNGCNDFIIVNTKMFCTSGNIAQSGTSYIVDNSTVNFLGLETGADINIFNGSLNFKNNSNASITTEDILLWRNGFFDPRTEVGAWNNTASPSITIRGGGKFIVDSGRTLTVT